MPNVKLKRGSDEWDILIPDVSPERAKEYALTLANGGSDEGGRGIILATNGMTHAEVGAQNRGLEDNDLDFTPPPKEKQWVVVDVLDDSEFPSTPDNIAAAEAAANEGGA